MPPLAGLPVELRLAFCLEVSHTMSLLRRYPLPYPQDSSSLFATLRGRPGAVFLDSGKPGSESGRYDIMSADPDHLFSLNSNNYEDYLIFFRDISTTLAGHFEAMTSAPDLPFSGGAIGYLSFDAGEAATLQRPITGDSLPAVYIGLYAWAVVVDHQRRRCELVAQASVGDEAIAALHDLLTQPPSNVKDFRLAAPFSSNMALPAYRRAFDRILAYIHAGDCYQINLSRQYQARYSGEPWAAYQKLRRRAAAPFSAYLNTGQGQLLSLSPERFLAADKGRIFSQPIKGTAARSDDPQQDAALASALQASDKNRAENVMIVDLLRNDLSKTCLPFSVRAEQLFELHSFATVHHLISTVSGQLRPECRPFDALLASFPGGSITGAPKKRAMEVIRELEPHRRGPYCGSVFYLSSCGRMDSNITIRSFVCADGDIRAWSGGGIVADSNCEEEFRETETKMAGLMAVLGD